MHQAEKVPTRAWVVTFAGTAVNLCLGILYAWSVWKAELIASEAHPAGSPMGGRNLGWTYLTDSQATSAYAICGVLFALMMIPGGRIQDRYGPRFAATLGGLFLAVGCVAAGLLKSYTGLILGFGVLGGVGMGLGYASATPAAVKWFGPHRRGLIVGLVVAGYGGAAIYISPLAKYLIDGYGLTGSFVGLGLDFAVVTIAAARLLKPPPDGYRAPVPPTPAGPSPARSTTSPSDPVDWTARRMLGTWQFYALLFLFFGSSQCGLLVIANATPILIKTAKGLVFFDANAWILASYVGIVNALGRVATGSYSDRIGRANAYAINGLAAAACLFALPWIMASNDVGLLFLAVGVATWAYGGGLALMPAITADYYGPRNLGLNYGLVFLGWGLAFFVPQVAGVVRDATGSLDAAFLVSGSLLLAAVILSRVVRRPIASTDESGLPEPKRV